MCSYPIYYSPELKFASTTNVASIISFDGEALEIIIFSKSSYFNLHKIASKGHLNSSDFITYAHITEMRRSYQFRLVPLILIFNFTQETASFNNLKLSYYQTKNRFHNRWKTSAVPVSFEVSEIRGALIDAIQNQNYRHLNETTQKLLSTSDVGEWDKDAFDDAESIIEAWSRRQSKKAALEVERLLRRIVKEQEAGNPNADTVDMTSLYSNLIIGWSNCIEVGSAERAEEILEYYQKVYEEHDNYDPLLCGPDANSFNAVIAGYARSTRPDAPEQAIRVLGKMYDWIGEGRTVVQPNKETYARKLPWNFMKRFQ